jgi:hypothetical protein
LTACDGFDEEDKRSDREDIMMGGERGEPGYLEIPHPDYENGNVDWEEPDHQDKERMSIVEE